MTVKYPFKNSYIDAPDAMWELEQKIHQLVTAGKSEEAIALVRQTDIGAFITPEVVAQMKLIVETEEAASTGVTPSRLNTE